MKRGNIMRITKYSTELDKERKNILVKEDSKNCPHIDSLDAPIKIMDMLNYIYNANVKAEEYIWLIALDTKCKPIGIFEISHGTVNSSMLSAREVFIRLCLCGATYCVLAHNHPSGDTTPSKEDFEVTTRIKEAGEVMNIKLLDHVIVGEHYYSFRENKNMICG